MRVICYLTLFVLLSCTAFSIGITGKLREAGAGETSFHELKWDGARPPLLIVVRGSKFERLAQRDLPDIDLESSILIGAESLDEDDRTFVAKNCRFLLKSGPVQVRGDAKTIDFSGETHLAVMSDAHVRTAIAVTGSDLDDFSSITAKTVKLDTTQLRITAEVAKTTIDCSKRE